MIKTIFVDFFDTIMFRKIHSFQLLPQWEKKLKSNYPQLNDVDLISLRKESIREIGKIEYEIAYRKLSNVIYNKLVDKYNFTVSFDAFFDYSYRSEMFIDYATQYPNKRMIKYLKKQYKLGKDIYIVSDYNLPKEVYEIYLDQFNLGYLFKDIFSSSDYGYSKHNGTLYKLVGEKLNIDLSEVLMIGDSKHSDVTMALKSGIGKAKRYFPFIHKVNTNISKITNKDFSKIGKKYIFKKAQKSDNFIEYSIPLYYSIEKIYTELLKSNCDQNVLFLARGGYFLEKLFNEYQSHKKTKFNTVYFKNSRYVNKLTGSDEEQKEILGEYLKENSKDNSLVVVDEGWNCTSQLFFTNQYGYNTRGYYLGTFVNDDNKNAIREGVLFNTDIYGNKSKYYGIFRTNCTFYEQILTAPHGSLRGYTFDGGKIGFIEEWNEKEKNLYEKYTKDIQNKLRHNFIAIDAWDIKYDDKYIAHKLIRTLLFSSKKRLELLKQFDISYYDNMKVQTKSQQNIRDVNISLKSLICHPEDNMRFFCKLKELFYKKKIRILYYPLGICIYLYIKLILLLKGL